MVALEKAVQGIEDIAEWGLSGNKELEEWGRLLTKAEEAVNITQTADGMVNEQAQRSSHASKGAGSGELGVVTKA